MKHAAADIFEVNHDLQLHAAQSGIGGKVNGSRVATHGSPAEEATDYRLATLKASQGSCLPMNLHV